MEEIEAHHIALGAIDIWRRLGAVAVGLLMWILIVLVTWTSSRNFWNDERQDGFSRRARAEVPLHSIFLLSISTFPAFVKVHPYYTDALGLL